MGECLHDTRRDVCVWRNRLRAVVLVASGCRERHTADGRAVAGRQADQNQLGHKEARPQDYKRKYVAPDWR